MKSVGLVWVIAACGPVVTSTPGGDAHVAAREALLAVAGDATKLEAMFHGVVMNGGMWFDEPKCAVQFASGGPVPPDQLAAFAHCLAGLHLQASPREDALADVVVLSYPPGMEIEARVQQEENGPHLSWIGYESRRAIDAMIPTITVDALDSIRLTGDRNGPLEANIASTLELDQIPKSHAAYSWIRLCVDETGNVTLAHTFSSTSPNAAKVFEAAAEAWTFRPFTIGNRVIPVCSMVRMTYPIGQGPETETLPLPPPMSRGHTEALVFVNPKFLDGSRIAGNKLITPDDQTKGDIQASNVSKIVGSYRICIDDQGAVESVLPIRATGFAAYDRKIIGTISSTWRYSPYLVNGQPVPVCTAVTFIYSQR